MSSIPHRAWSVRTSLALAATLLAAGSAAAAPQAPQATRHASLVYVYYGNPDFITFTQETLKLRKAMEDYDFVVLLKEERTPSWLDLSEKDEKLANTKDLPTKANLFKYLVQLTAQGYWIDLYIFAHGNTGEFSAMAGGAGGDDVWYVHEQEIRDELAPAKTGFTRIPIRMVWGTYCYGQSLGDVWRSVGARTTAGARHVQFYPNAFGKFVEAWNKGDVSFERAVADSDTDAVRTVAQLGIVAHSKLWKKNWGSCKGLQTVLGDDPCARDYFLKWRGRDAAGKDHGWLPAGEWQAGKNGKDNMTYSSFMFIGGEKGITKGPASCTGDGQCGENEFCTAGVLDLARNVCKEKKAHGATCTNQRQCLSNRCAWGFCADADECQADSDCGSGDYCGDPISGKRTCKDKLAHGKACTKAEQCATGRCSWGFCADADECQADSDCGSGDYCGDPISGKRTCKDKLAHGKACTKADQCATGRCSWGLCADADECRADADCGSGNYCGDPISGKRTCKDKLAHGKACTKGDQCASGKCTFFTCK